MKPVRSATVLLSLLLVIGIFSGAALQAQPENGERGVEALKQTAKAFTSVANKAVPAVVAVQVEKEVQVNQMPRQLPFDDDFFERFFGPQFRQRQQQPRIQRGQGSGFIVSKDGYILTNNHVVGEADKITVTLSDSRQFEAEMVGTDPKSDVAVIKIDAKNLPVIELGDSDALQIGEWVIAVGNPFGLTETVTVGVCSAKGRGIGITGQEGYEDFIQTDAAINPGNSGGPLLNIDGKAIGVNTAIFSQSGGYMGIGFAIPINMAKVIMDQLIETGKVTRGYVGIYLRDVDAELAKYFDLKPGQGVQVIRIMEGTPAEEAGLKQGDIILEVNGNGVEGVQQFRNKVAMLAPGTKIDLLVMRDGEKQQMQLTVGSLEDAETAMGMSDLAEQLGLQVQNMTEELADRFEYTAGEGVIVTEVQPNSPAARVGIEPGMAIMNVNRTDVNSVEDFNKALAQSQGGRVLMLVKQGRFVEWVVLRFEQQQD